METLPQEEDLLARVVVRAVRPAGTRPRCPPEVVELLAVVDLPVVADLRVVADLLVDLPVVVDRPAAGGVHLAALAVTLMDDKLFS